MLAVLLLTSLMVGSHAQSTAERSRLQAVEAWAQVQEAPAQITLRWPATDDATGYKITRRADGSFVEVANLDAGATNWMDVNVAVGQRYEYRIVKSTGFNYIGQAYVTAGIKAGVLNDTGKVLVLSRDNVASALEPEIERLRQDLILEGWEVARQTVSGSATAPEVRNAIREVWQSSAGKLKSVILLGHVPVPYSGAIFPDGHSNHFGAWPADGFYGDIDGTWTDSTVNTQVAERENQWNVPGDGKYDQSTYPSAVDLAVGRIDFFEMTNFGNKTPSRSEIDLTRAYLNKNHNFRSGNVQLTRRGLVLDNFGLRDTNGVASTAYRNFAGFFGATNVAPMELDTYFPRLKTESALCTWGAGGGSYYYASGVGTSDDFALMDVNVVFSFWLGSYFGDWNNESNWLKAALGSGQILVSMYAGIPHSQLHHMALGGTIGDAFVLTQNNRQRDSYFPDTQGLNEVHQALLGDPTLRLFPRGGLRSASGSGGAGQATLRWAAPSGATYMGAHIYRSSSPAGPFTQVTSAPIAGDNFTDSPSAGTYSYLVRPVWLETTGSGTFQNPGQGTVVAGLVVGQGTTAPPILSALKTSDSILTLQVQAAQGKPVVIETSDFTAGWTSVSTNTSPQGEPLRFDMPTTPAKAQFFRARY